MLSARGLALCLSLVQRDPTECDMPVTVKPRQRGGPGSLRAVAP
jgi:hypothetical protein